MKRKIMFIVPSLRGGGAEKVMVTLLRHMNRDQFEVMLVLLSGEGKYFSDVPKEITVHNLGTDRVRHSLFSLIKLINRVKPDVVFSTQGHLNIAIIALKAFIGKRTKIVVRESNTVSELLKVSSKPWIWKRLYKVFYKKADLVICQSKFMLNDLHQNFHIPAAKLVQIYNPIDFNRIDYLSKSDPSPFVNKENSLNIVALGRLTFQKGFDRLIEAIPGLLKKRPQAKLWIIGEGSLKEELQQKTAELGLTEKINFINFQDNPYKWLKHADLFILSSYYEGLPNVLLEAIACDCPVIAVNHPGGTGEIMEITNQKNRYIDKLEWELNWFDKPHGKTKTLLFEEFNVGKIVKKYESLFQNR